MNKKAVKLRLIVYCNLVTTILMVIFLNCDAEGWLDLALLFWQGHINE